MDDYQASEEGILSNVFCVLVSTYLYSTTTRFVTLHLPKLNAMARCTIQIPPSATKPLSMNWKDMNQWPFGVYSMYQETLDSIRPKGGGAQYMIRRVLFQ